VKGCIGGTFDVLHQGHLLLFQRAFEHFEFLVVGITSDAMVGERKIRRIRPYDERAKRIDSYLSKHSPIPYDIVSLGDPYGPALNEDMGAIVVSTETQSGALNINRIRGEKGILPLKIFTVDMLCLNGVKVSSGDYLRTEGVKIAVGSRKKSKLQGTKMAFLRFFPRVETTGIEVEGTVGDQLRDDDILEGALSYALQARQESDGHFFVGIESGVMELGGHAYSLHGAYVLGDDGFVSSGLSSAFLLPEGVLLGVEDGATLKEAVESLRIKTGADERGAAEVLSRGMLQREKLYEEAVVAALIPFENPGVYGSGKRTWPLTDNAHDIKREKMNIDWR